MGQYNSGGRAVKPEKIQLPKRPSSTGKSEPRPSRSGNGVCSVSLEEKAQNKTAGRAIEPETIRLPTVSKLLEIEKGLCGVLEADVFNVYNSEYGTNSNIAAKIMVSLGQGRQLPDSISNEIPFLRSSDEIELGGKKTKGASRFVGVFRVKKNLDNGKEEIGFGVTLPQFYVKCDWSSQVERTENGYILPKAATVNGRPLLVRIGIDDEAIAGKLFSFMYRVLYGAEAVSDILAERGSLGNPSY